MIKPFHLDFDKASNKELIEIIDEVLADCEREIPKEVGVRYSYLLDLRDALNKASLSLKEDNKIKALSVCYDFLNSHDLYKRADYHQSIYQSI